MATSDGTSRGSEKKVGSKSDDKEIDDELDKLLDSALADFEEGKNAGKPQQQQQQPQQQSEGAKAKKSSAGDPISDLFADEFSDEMAKEFEDAMKQFMANDPAMLQQIEKLAEAAGNSGDAEGQKEFDDTLKETLNNLAHNTEGLQDSPTQTAEAEMMKMFSGMGLEGGGADDAFMPMMQGMMKTLLSKEVLYPSLKDISDKYPDWLKNNKEKISEKEYNNYKSQYEIIIDILSEFGKEKETDTDDVKKERFGTVMDKMQKMQDLGQPPKEIVGDMAPGLEFDANGVPKFPSPQEGCSVM